MPEIPSQQTVPGPNGVAGGYKDAPAGLKAFLWHGVTLTPAPRQAQGDCPFCGREGKLYVRPEDGLWDCKACARTGNPLTFLRQWWEECDRVTRNYGPIRENRKLLYEETLMHWGLVQSPLTGEWLLPGYNAKGALVQLYRYSKVTERKKDGSTSKRMALLPTPGLHHGLFGVKLIKEGAAGLIICEGPWDGMAWWELLKGGGDYNVVAVPSCSSWHENWQGPAAGKDVVIAFDNDWPKSLGGKADLAGFKGGARVAGLVSSDHGALGGPARSVKVLLWGPDGYNRNLKDGFDVRDALAEAGNSLDLRKSASAGLFSLVKPAPAEWLTAGKAKGVRGQECLNCESWRTLRTHWVKSMQWTEGLDAGLLFMLAICLSTELPGEQQIWGKLMGPPSSGKTTLCEAVSTAREYVYPMSTFRGMHSGYKTDKQGAEDHSLIPKLRNKTFVVKDGDTLLQLPNLPQVLSEMRDVFDGSSRSHYRHGVSRAYENVRMTFILCGTSSLRKLDNSELGARFIDLTIMDEVDEGFEREVGLRTVYRTVRNMKREAGSSTLSADEERDVARRMTGGYVNYLRQHARELVDLVGVSDETAELLVDLGTFVACMRARPSTRQDEVHEREFSPRIVEQYTRLAVCLAAVLNKAEVDAEVIKLVRRAAMDTAKGRVLNVCKCLRAHGGAGVELPKLAVLVGETADKLQTLMGFLLKINVVTWTRHEVTRGIRTAPRWLLTPQVGKLFDNLPPAG